MFCSTYTCPFVSVPFSVIFFNQSFSVSLSQFAQSRMPAVKVKYLMVAWLGVLVTSWVVYIQYSSYSELCRGHVCTMLIVSYCTTVPRIFNTLTYVMKCYNIITYAIIHYICGFFDAFLNMEQET